MDASHVYVRARALGCFQSYLFRNLSEGADRVGGQLRGDKECPFSGVTKSGKFGGRCRKAMHGVWRKVPESDAWSVFAQMDDMHLLTMHSDIMYACDGSVGGRIAKRVGGGFIRNDSLRAVL